MSPACAPSCGSAPGRFGFANAFRKRLLEYVEYSLDADPERLGVMIFGDGCFLDELARFLEPLDYTHAWLRGVRRFAAAVKPVNYLFKVDFKHDEVAAVSLYCRFVENVPARDLSQALAVAEPSNWEGPSPHAIGEALGTSWPHGMGLRVSADRRCHAAVYNKVSLSSLEFRRSALPRLLEVCALPPELERRIREDMALVTNRGAAGVIGVDGGREQVASAVKLDAEAVPVPWALTFAGARGASPARIRELGLLANALRVTRAGYLGLKYDATGFAGWKLYFALSPRLTRAALLPRLDVNRWSIH